MNLGERSEILLKFMLIQLRDGKVAIPSPIRVKSVGFGGLNYPTLPKGLDIKGLVSCSDDELIMVANNLGITKAASRSKSDVHINGIGFSVKSLSSAPPALANHTARPGFENACIYSGVDIRDLDPIVDHYWHLREEGLIGEDIKNSAINSPFKEHKEMLGKVLEYFLFTGTGSGISQFPAEYILDYDNPLNPSTWRILSKDDAINELWENLIFSIRAKKGMPVNYPFNRNNRNNDSIAMWTRKIHGQYKGSLHIRAARNRNSK